MKRGLEQKIYFDPIFWAWPTRPRGRRNRPKNCRMGCRNVSSIVPVSKTSKTSFWLTTNLLVASSQPLVANISILD
jgi:hypothetical protein